MDNKYEGLEIWDVWRGHKSVIGLSWRHPKIGFGEFAFFWDDEGRLCMDTEYMSDEFVEALLKELIKLVKRVD